MLNELYRQEWNLKTKIAQEVKGDLVDKKLNVFSALYPYEPDGTVFYLTDRVDSYLFDFLTRISDCVITPISPGIDASALEKRYGGLKALLKLWEGKKVLPMLSHSHESYVGKDFLDPLLERQPPCGAVRSRILLRVLLGDIYNNVATVEKRFTQYVPDSHGLRSQAASILTELKTLGQGSIAQTAERIMTANFLAGCLLAWQVAKISTAPLVSGFGGMCQFVDLVPVIEEVLPWGEVRRYETATEMLRIRLDPDNTRCEELKCHLLRLDESSKRGVLIEKSVEEVMGFEDSGGRLMMTIFSGDVPAISALGWKRIPLVSWESGEPKTDWRGRLNLKEIRPGDSAEHPSGMVGTLGGFGLDDQGRIIPFTAGHVSTGGYSDTLSSFYLGEPDEEIRYVTFNLRIRGLDEDLPAVLKKPIKPRKDMEVIMIGWRSGLQKGLVTDVSLPRKPHHFRVGGRTFPVDGRLMFTARLTAKDGDSGALVLSEEGRFPVGMVIASSCDDPDVTYCHRLVDVTPRFGIQGIFCPLGIPMTASKKFRQVVASVVPDGLFVQDSGITLKGEQEILNELGAKIDGESVGRSIGAKSGGKHLPRRVESERKLSSGMRLKIAGRLAFDENDEIIGIVFAGSNTHSLSMPLWRVEKALRLRLINRGDGPFV